MSDADKPNFGFDPDFDIGEAFMQANANPEHIGSMIADFTRQMMRASLSSQPRGSTMKAYDTFLEMLKYMRRMPQGVNLFQCFDKAEEYLRVDSRPGGSTDEWILAAAAGAKAYVELSSTDGFSGARKSKALRDFRFHIDMAKNR